MDAPVELDAPCGKWFTYRDLVECGNTWVEHAASGAPVDNAPRNAATYAALKALAESILDPLSDAFGRPKLTYGFASSRLTGKIRKSIAPRLDQHASCEAREDGEPICDRGGAAVDLLVPGRSALEIARWVASNTPFDRLYIYGNERPIHVSHGPQAARAVFEMTQSLTGPTVPRRLRW